MKGITKVNQEFFNEHFIKPDESYDMVVFDPPHLKNGGDTGWIILKYGRLPSEWLPWIERAFKECFRVLKNDGVLVFKWNSEQIPFANVVKLSPYKPIFGDKRAKTRWTVFVKDSALRRKHDNRQDGLYTEIY